jgi:gamma-glutamyltranspeptidase / glutathione hydrolase
MRTVQRAGNVREHIDRRSFLAWPAAILGAKGWPRVLATERSEKVGMVIVGGLPQATEAGLAVLRQGGNAVDAAVTAALASGVVGVYSCGIGGYGGAMIIAAPGKTPTCVDFNTIAPAAARGNLFKLDRKGQVPGRVNEYGWLASGVPGTLAGMQFALDRFGTYNFRQAVEPAIRFATEGFPITHNVARQIAAAREFLGKDPGSAQLFLDGHQPRKQGERFRNPDLGKMLQTLAQRNSVDSFYRGDIARQIARAFQDNQGLVTAKDLASYRARQVNPLHIEWQGYDLYTAPLGAGGLTTLETIAILKALGWHKKFIDAPGDPETFRARLEATRLAWHDRLNLLGDPEKGKVPVDRLLSGDHAEELAKQVRASLKSGKPVITRTPPHASDGTVSLSVVDGRGMMVALTLTHGGAFGARVTVPGLGLVLGQGMARFDPHPSHPNSPGPGKRPLHNMSPTVALRDRRPVLALGGAGGRRIPNSVLDIVIRVLIQNLPIDGAVQAPRLSTEGGMDVILDGRWPDAVVGHLRKTGYGIVRRSTALISAVTFDAKASTFHAAAR